MNRMDRVTEQELLTLLHRELDGLKRLAGIMEEPDGQLTEGGEAAFRDNIARRDPVLDEIHAARRARLTRAEQAGSAGEAPQGAAKTQMEAVEAQIKELASRLLEKSGQNALEAKQRLCFFKEEIRRLNRKKTGIAAYLDSGASGGRLYNIRG